MLRKPNPAPTRGRRAALVATVSALALVATLGCNAHSSLEAAAERPGEGSASAAKNANADGRAADPGINLNCVIDHIQNPPESFHYSYRKDASDHLDEEADITPQTIDGSFTNSGFHRAFHGVHADPQNWQSAWSGLTGISGMSSTIALVNHDSATVREPGSSQVNGYTVIHYTIDTARFNATERQILGPTMGPGGFEKGDAWVDAQGCPVKLSLDSELHRNDGSLLEKIHYEEAMVKK